MVNSSVGHLGIIFFNSFIISLVRITCKIDHHPPCRCKDPRTRLQPLRTDLGTVSHIRIWAFDNWSNL
ncbi:hypothetical protein LguiA_002555 [Lonicera macranthoides]